MWEVSADVWNIPRAGIRSSMAFKKKTALLSPRGFKACC
jgi:hypothetical protein